MRRAITAFVATVAGLVLLLSFKTTTSKSPGRPAALSGPTAGTGNGGASGETSTPPPAASTSPSPAAKAASGTKTITGSSVPVTEGFRTFGNIQVRVTVTNGRITNLEAVDYPHRDPQSLEISQYSIPVLQQEVLSAQGTHIDMISGATYTSEAYAQSVQAALDQAKS